MSLYVRLAVFFLISFCFFYSDIVAAQAVPTTAGDDCASYIGTLERLESEKQDETVRADRAEQQTVSAQKQMQIMRRRLTEITRLNAQLRQAALIGYRKGRAEESAYNATLTPVEREVYLGAEQANNSDSSSASEPDLYQPISVYGLGATSSTPLEKMKSSTPPVRDNIIFACLVTLFFCTVLAWREQHHFQHRELKRVVTENRKLKKISVHALRLSHARAGHNGFYQDLARSLQAIQATVTEVACGLRGKNEIYVFRQRMVWVSATLNICVEQVTTQIQKLAPGGAIPEEAT
ncbi:MAG: hypothetical protein HYV32_01610 [Candidatus Kerfeldbacteria bacterium]|nr:hypothetical protein [Candidatus Kerfeldbacteria bacterium]